MPLAPGLEPVVLERVRRLSLMGFGKDEIHPIIESQFGTTLTQTEYQEVWAKHRTSMGKMPELPRVKEEIGQTWQRSEMIQNDLLAVYQLLVSNFNAYMDGETEIVDPHTGNIRPVIPVRPNDLISVADKVLKIDQERVMSMLNTLKVLPSLEPDDNPATEHPMLPGGIGMAALISSPAPQLSAPDDGGEVEDDEEDWEPLDADYESTE